MKRLIVAGVLVVILTMFCVSHYFIIKNFYDDMNQKLITCLNHTQDNVNEQPVRDLTESWEKRRGIIAVFVNRTTIEEIDVSLSKLSAFCDSKSYNLYVAECNVIEDNLKKIKLYSEIQIGTVL